MPITYKTMRKQEVVKEFFRDFVFLLIFHILGFNKNHASLGILDSKQLIFTCFLMVLYVIGIIHSHTFPLLLQHLARFPSSEYVRPIRVSCIAEQCPKELVLLSDCRYLWASDGFDDCRTTSRNAAIV